MSTSKLIYYFSSHPAAFGFQASLPPDNFTITAANRIDQGLSDFQTGIAVVVHASLDAEQLFSHTQTAPIDTFSSVQGLESGVIAVSEEHELFTKIHDILDNAVC